MLTKTKAAALMDTSPKNMKPFRLETPEKNIITGFISKSRTGYRLGSMIIDEVNGVETLQYVQGMPKIGYLDARSPATDDIHIYRKLDGTNITIFPLIVNGTVEEILYKTRGEPRVQNSFMKRVELNDTTGHETLVEDKGVTISCELYGYQNPHAINYMKQKISIGLDMLTMLDKGASFDPLTAEYNAMKYDIPFVARELTLQKQGNSITAIPTIEMIDTYSEYMPEGQLPVATNIIDLYYKLEEYFDQINDNYQAKKKGGIITEGTVWNLNLSKEVSDSYHLTTRTLMVKNKPRKVKEEHILVACGIPGHVITKAMFKAEEQIGLDDYSAVSQFIKDELSEEFSKEMIDDLKTEQKIRSMYGKKTKEFVITLELEEYARAVHEEVGEKADVSVKLRAFAEIFPDHKKQSRKMFQYFSGMR